MGLLGVVLPQSKIFVNFVNFQVVFILLILVFDLKSCFYVCFNRFKWSQVEEISRRLKEKKTGSKSEPKQGKNKALRNFAGWRKLLWNEHFVAKPFRNTVEVSASVFRSCESGFGTRVPLRSTVASIWQLWNPLRSGKTWFRTKSPIPQGISQLRKWIWHTSATSQHSDINFAAAKLTTKLLRKWQVAAKLAFCCET